MRDSGCFLLAVMVESTTSQRRKCIMANNKAKVTALLAALQTLTEAEMLALTENPGKLKKFLGKLVANAIANTFVIALSDHDVQERFPQFVDRIPSWRRLAVELDYRGPIAWRVKKGFTLKKCAPKAGPCYKRLEYLQDWDFKDEPTEDLLVFWIPRRALESTSKTIDQMVAHRDELRKRYELPETHATSFGSIAPLFALILAHFKRTGERVPLSCFYAVSDTLRAVGYRLIAGSFDVSSGLHCRSWSDSNGSDDVGFFLLGVEKVVEQEQKLGQ